MKKAGVKSEKIAAIRRFQIEGKWVSIFAFLAFLFLLLPIMRLMLYTTPWYDDYSYSLVSRRFWVQDHSWRGVLEGAWYTARTNWWAWQGTFSSGFVMSLMPGLFGEKYYFIGPMLILLVLVLGCFALVHALVRNVMGGDFWDCLCLQAGVAGITVVLIHSPLDGFFWYNAGVHYVMMYGFFLLLAAALVKLLYARNKFLIGLLLIWSLLGAVLTGGSNYVTALQGLIVVFTLLILGIVFFRKRVLLLLPSFLMYLFCFYKNVAAPGNAVRTAVLASGGVERKGALFSILDSFVEAFKHLPVFSGWLLFLIILLLFPSIWNMVRKSAFQFRFPGLVTVYSICLYATGFTPSLYSLGNSGPSRTLNAVKLTYQLLLIINIVYWLGWAAHKKNKSKVFEKNIPAYWWFYFLIGGCMTVMILLFPYIARECLSYRAYQDVHSGVAYNYYQEYQNRIALIHEGEADVQVPPYFFRSELLTPGELSPDSSAGQNRSMANWYDKNSLSLKIE